MEEVEAWIARDESGSLWCYTDVPRKDKVRRVWCSTPIATAMLIEDSYFPNIKWEDKEPTKVKITLIK